jgi:alkaline phosphatase
LALWQVILGGGRQCLVSNVSGTIQDPIDTWACYRKDGLDLIKHWKDTKQMAGARHKFVSTNKDLRQTDLKDVDYLLGIFANGFLKYEYERDKDAQPSLSEMTTAAVKVLDKGENGYLLVVSLIWTQ